MQRTAIIIISVMPSPPILRWQFFSGVKPQARASSPAASQRFLASMLATHGGLPTVEADGVATGQRNRCSLETILVSAPAWPLLLGSSDCSEGAAGLA